MTVDAFTILTRPQYWIFPGFSSDLPTWTVLLLLAVQLLVIGQIFRAWIGPFILRKISKRVRVRRVSLRSIRGIYVHMASMTIRIDRVGLSYHSSGEAPRRFSLKVEGLHVEVHELKQSRRPRQSISRRFSRMPSLADFAPSPMASVLWSAYSSVYELIGPYARPVIRSFFVTSVRVVIRCLPVLTQVVDFELDRAIITLTTVPEAHVAIRGVTLTAAVAFSNLESVVARGSESNRNRQHQRFLSMSHLQNRLSQSTKRVLGRAWGSTRGCASIGVKVQKVSGYASTDKWSQLNPDATNSSKFAVASEFAFVTHTSHYTDMCFDLQDSAELVASFKFGPTKTIIQEHSISSSLKMPSIQFSINPLQVFMGALKGLRKQSSLHTTTASSNGHYKVLSLYLQVDINIYINPKRSLRFAGNDSAYHGSHHSSYKVSS